MRRRLEMTRRATLNLFELKWTINVNMFSFILVFLYLRCSGQKNCPKRNKSYLMMGRWNMLSFVSEEETNTIMIPHF